MTAPDFTFSQYSIQDFLDCQRRFLLRHVLRLAWPAAETDDQAAYELHQDQGQAFHRCLQQYFSGIPEEAATASISDELLAGWWRNFLAEARGFPWNSADSPAPGLILLPEFTLTARLGEHRVSAKYDLVAALSGEHFWIYDWKTSRSIPPREKLELRVQTRLYCWLLAAAGSALNASADIPPEHISMTYWYVQQPSRPVSFVYSAEQFATDRQQLGDLLDYIASISEVDFRLTDDPGQCRFCTYRSYCERGFSPGAWSELSGESDLSSALENLPEWEDSSPLEL